MPISAAPLCGEQLLDTEYGEGFQVSLGRVPEYPPHRQKKDLRRKLQLPPSHEEGGSDLIVSQSKNTYDTAMELPLDRSRGSSGVNK